MKANYLAIDPGHMCGYALFDGKGEIASYGQFSMDKTVLVLTELIEANELKHIIVEDYRNYGHMQQKKWSRNDTSKIIGKIETLAEIHNIPVFLQGAHVKIIGYKWAGLGEAPSNHKISHQFDAVAHGVYFLQQNVIRPVGLSIPSSENKEK